MPLFAGRRSSVADERARGDRAQLRRYREAPEILYAVVIEPREVLAEIYARGHDWQPRVLRNPGDAIAIPEFGLHCIMADLYRGTPLDPQRKS